MLLIIFILSFDSNAVDLRLIHPLNITSILCTVWQSSWWRHQMGTFSALLVICAGNSPAPGEFPAQRPVTRNFDVFFDQRLNKRLSKQSWSWWFETLSRSFWRHRNVVIKACLEADYSRMWLTSPLMINRNCENWYPNKSLINNEMWWATIINDKKSIKRP